MDSGQTYAWYDNNGASYGYNNGTTSFSSYQNGKTTYSSSGTHWSDSFNNGTTTYGGTYGSTNLGGTSLVSSGPLLQSSSATLLAS